MKYIVKIQLPMFMDVEVEAESPADAREMALLEVKDKSILDYQQGYPDVFEVEWTDEDGINTII